MGASLQKELKTDNPGSAEVCSSDMESDRSVSFKNIYIQLIFAEHRTSSIKTLPGSLADCPAFENLLPLCSVNMGLSNKIFSHPNICKNLKLLGDFRLPLWPLVPFLGILANKTIKISKQDNQEPIRAANPNCSLFLMS